MTEESPLPALVFVAPLGDGRFIAAATEADLFVDELADSKVLECVGIYTIQEVGSIEANPTFVNARPAKKEEND